MEKVEMANDDYRVPFSRALMGRTPSGYSRTSSVSTVDTKNIQFYLRRQNSRSSLQSSASAGLITSDNASSASSSHSRPVSAEANNAMAPHQSSVGANTRVILPSPSVPRVFPPALMTPITRSTSIPSLAARRRSSYLDKLVCRVCDYLYMGGIEAAYNANLLCRLNIEYVIDISNIEPLKVPRHKKSDCPCLCPLTTAHSRVRMTILIDEGSPIDLLPYFDDVNRFIDSARSCNKSVLVHSYNGRNRCAALVIPYLMKMRKVNLERAIGLLTTMRSDIHIGENFMKALRKWDSTMQQLRDGNEDGEEEENTKTNGDGRADGRPFIGPFTNNRFVHGTPGLKRSAWI